MPFTFSHPAIILPLTITKQLRLSATGLVIGSMTPDFEYFIRMKVQSDYSHTLVGLFWVNLPLGLILCFIYHRIVRNSLFDNSPAFIQKRLDKFKSFNWIRYFALNWFIVSISIIIGAFSHLLWDSFTHETGYFVERSSLLKQSVNFFGLAVPIYKIIQHVSSLAGGLIIIAAFLTIERTKTRTTGNTSKYWICIFLIMSAVVLLRLFFGLKFNQYGTLIVTIISAGLAALILTPLILKKNKFS